MARDNFAWYWVLLLCFARTNTVCAAMVQQGFLLANFSASEACLGRDGPTGFHATSRACSSFEEAEKTWYFGYDNENSDWLHLIDDACLTYDGDDDTLKFFGNCLTAEDQAWSLVGDMLYNTGNDVCAWAFASGDVQGHPCNYTGCSSPDDCTRKWVFNTSAPLSNGVLKSNLSKSDLCLGRTGFLAQVQDCSSISELDRTWGFGGEKDSVTWLHLLDDDCLTYDGDGSLKFFHNCIEPDDQAWSLQADGKLYNAGNDVCAWAFADGSVQGLPCDYSSCDVTDDCSSVWAFERASPGTRPLPLLPILGAASVVVVLVIMSILWWRRRQAWVRQKQAALLHSASSLAAGDEEGAAGVSRRPSAA